MSMTKKLPSTQEKALQINLDAQKYGTFAEIGAGQEVARWFFHVGKASSTVAKSISAYDVAISDDLYGATDHYVSRPRLEAMLDREFGQLSERLKGTRGEKDAFFVFADTVATHSSSPSQTGHGWLGVRFQDQAGAEPSEVIIHIEMLDVSTGSQQEAVGILGVNLVYGACYHSHDPNFFVGMLMDGLDRRRIEVDMIKFSGPAFRDVDNRLIILHAVEQGLTDAVMFTADGEVVQPSEVLQDRPVLIERGSFRPVTNVTLEMLEAALPQLRQDTKLAGDPIILMEMTLSNLMSGPEIDHQDFLARADILATLGKTVMISNYTTFDRVTSYLRHYTQKMVAMVVGVPTLQAIFEEKYYSDLEGGILEGLGRLFSGPTKVLVYPTVDTEGAHLKTADKLSVAPELAHLYAHLFENRFIESVLNFEKAQWHVSPGDVRKKIQSGDPTWQSLVPAEAAALIVQKGLFGYRRPSGSPPD